MQYLIINQKSAVAFFNSYHDRLIPLHRTASWARHRLRYTRERETLGHLQRTNSSFLTSPEQGKKFVDALP